MFMMWEFKLLVNCGKKPGQQTSKRKGKGKGVPKTKSKAGSKAGAQMAASPTPGKKCMDNWQMGDCFRCVNKNMKSRLQTTN